jgi:hypothetical protein
MQKLRGTSVYSHAVNDIVHTSVSAQAGWGLGTPSPLPNGHLRGNLAMQIAAELSMGAAGEAQPNANNRMVQLILMP